MLSKEASYIMIELDASFTPPDDGDHLKSDICDG